jgi:hypothetical protein
MLFLLLLLQSAPLIEENLVPIDETKVIQLVPVILPDPGPALGISIVAGGLSSLGTQESYSITPMAKIEIDARTSDRPNTPHLYVRAMLSALSGESLNIEDVTTFKTLEFEAGLEQPIPGIYPRLYLGVGLATRLPGDTEPRINAPKYLTAGVLFTTIDRASYLYVGGGPDQRLSSDNLYEPTVHVEGQVRLAQYKEAKLFLSGEAILGSNHSQIRVGVTVGI